MNIQLLNFLKSQTKPILRNPLAKAIYTPEAGPYAPWTKPDIDRAERTLREDITELNAKGYPVLSGQKGIYFSEKIEDIEGWARFYREMGVSNIRKADSLDKIAKTIRDKNQMTIPKEKTDD